MDSSRYDAGGRGHCPQTVRAAAPTGTIPAPPPNLLEKTMKKLEDRPWWPELVELKDVLSLRELSTRFGAAPAAISNALKRSGMDRNAAPPGPRAKRDPDLQRAAAEALEAVETGTRKGGKTKSSKPAPAAAVEAPAPKAAKDKGGKDKGGKDKAKAAKVEVVAAPAPAPVEKAKPAKAAAKVAEAPAPKAKAVPAPAEPADAGGGSRITPYLHLLGKEIDRKIADMAGVSVSAVTNYRKRHGIPSATGSGPKPVKAAKAAKVTKAPAPVVEVPVALVVEAPAPVVETPAPVVETAAPVLAVPVAAATVGFGYRVTIGGEGFVVVAADIAEAARRAMESGRGQVTGVELLGTAIGA